MNKQRCFVGTRTPDGKQRGRSIIYSLGKYWYTVLRPIRTCDSNKSSYLSLFPENTVSSRYSWAEHRSDPLIYPRFIQTKERRRTFFSTLGSPLITLQSVSRLSERCTLLSRINFLFFGALIPPVISVMIHRASLPLEREASNFIAIQLSICLPRFNELNASELIFVPARKAPNRFRSFARQIIEPRC